MNGTDHFSTQSDDYARYRPRYPDALFQYLHSLCSSDELAWDCACGSGQATISLAKYFKRVIATDISSAQIEKAKVSRNTEYKVSSAECSGLDSQSLDLIVVAQALHWFDFDLFYNEASRVLKPDAILAVISYQLPRISTELDALIDHFQQNIVGNYWPPQRVYVDSAYGDIPFPLLELPSPNLKMEDDWTLNQLLGYLRSWSAVVYFEKEKGLNPLDLIHTELYKLWGERDSPRHLSWPLTLRIGKFTQLSK